ncbi:MAG: aldolase [Methylobacteriaceae bacterium]|jgi:ribulose-5-phosphate 4-epimerase/fuculose-1-phosphate aldolase|nr:aldolase [Methylobacteriaceae bacterium]
MEEAVLRESIVSIGASLYNRGFSVGTAGNISARLNDGVVIATPTNSCLGRLDPGALSVVDMNGGLVSGAKASKETAFHLALYRKRPDCGAVVHLHSTWLTALSCLDNLDTASVIRPFTPYYVMKVGHMPLIPYFRPGSPKIAEALAEHAGKANAFLLANHGPVVIGPTLADAAAAMEELEETAKLFFILKDFPVRYFSDEEIAELKG